MTFVNPCGGRRWRSDDDARIEVEDVGYPIHEPGTERYRQLENTWNNWGPIFQEAGERYDIPPSWIAAIATQETGLWASNPDRQRTIQSAEGAGSIGIMQPIPSTSRFYGYDHSEMYDPEKNIDVGAHLMADNAERVGYELPLIGARFNSGCSLSGGGRRCCQPGRNAWNLFVHTGSGYVENIIANNNTAIEFFDANGDRERLKRIVLYGAVGAGVVALGAVAWVSFRQAA